MKAISARIPDWLDARLAAESERSGTPKSQILRLALEEYFNGAERRPSAYDLSRDLCGIIKGGPPDVATNSKYLEGFGE